MAQSESEKTALTVAQLNAMAQGGTGLPHGSRLFDVPAGWESRMIAAGSGVPTCATMLSLEEALRDTEVKVIFVPLGALLTNGDIERVCQRNGVTKTIFREVEGTI